LTLIIRFAVIVLAYGTDRTGALRELIEGPAALSIHGVFPVNACQRRTATST
jgi:hypothetical protein